VGWCMSSGRSHDEFFRFVPRKDTIGHALARRMKANGETAATIYATLGIGRTTLYRYLAESDDARQKSLGRTCPPGRVALGPGCLMRYCFSTRSVSIL
jgi:Helix-turn-helix domain of resolvase